ncbi:alpha/beta hydrolase [Pedobacter sp. PAMC26386]|nr:alpha/beta hydrolase [Pedobacter sp. PAMC26386]
MKTSIKASLFTLLLSTFLGLNNYAQIKPRPIGKLQKANAAVVKNIVLVHGAFVDGSGWQPVYNILVKYGFKVSVVQQPLTSFVGDIAAVKRIIAMQDGPCILVGHSYGGAIITVAGNDTKVAGLVYIAAHAPDNGESEAENGKLYPSAYKSLQKRPDGYDYIDPSRFYEDFAADLPREQAEFEGHAQIFTVDSVFHAIIKNPAWRNKRSWYMVAKSDRIINPDLERMYAKRAGSTKVEIERASHSVYESHPKEVANLIIEAATQSAKKY